ncbi:MAG: pyridoxal phosphate-dependent aminotransferase [Planctomycetota bacterium]
MSISSEVKNTLSRSSWIRKMFEEGNRLKEVHGPENVFDFTLGNPDLPPPRQFTEKLQALVKNPPADLHRYMPNAGWPQARRSIARSLQQRTGLPYRGEHLVMTVGAGGALNVVFKALLDPEDEVIILCPYFVEYLFYIANHRGKTVTVETHPDFSIDLEAVEKSITPRTRAILINSPNNPTGKVYGKEELEALAEVLTQGSTRHGHPIYLISDEPYRKILYDDVICPEIPPLYPNTILVTSHSKDLGLAGERIGYLAVTPGASDDSELIEAFTFCNRTLGFVNAPSLFQLAVAECQDVAVDITPYRERRDLLLHHLRGLGLEVETPRGAFYLFPRSPIPDEREFVRQLMQERVLVVPGRGFGRSGYFRLSYAVPSPIIERSLSAWERATARKRKVQ